MTSLFPFTLVHPPARAVEDKTLMYADGPFFSGAVARVKSARPLGQGFDLLVAEAGREKALTLAGTGDLTLHSGDFKVDKVLQQEQGVMHT